MRLDLLVLIEGNSDAQRLIVTWTKAFLEYGHELGGSPKYLEADFPFTQDWARISGVDVDDIVRLAPMLFENGLLFDDGQVSETAARFMHVRGMQIAGVKVRT